MVWRELIRHNFWWKVASVALAMLIWVTIRTGVASNAENKTDIKISWEGIPIQILSAPENSDIYRVSPATVTVEVRGAPDRLATLRSNDVPVYVRVPTALRDDGERLRIWGHAPEGVRLRLLDFSEAFVEKAKPERQSLRGDAP